MQLFISINSSDSAGRLSIYVFFNDAHATRTMFQYVRWITRRAFRSQIQNPHLGSG